MTTISIVDLTSLTWGLLQTLDKGKHAHITERIVRDKIDDGTIFEFLKNEMGADTSLLDEPKRKELLEHWQALNNVVDWYDNNGICLVLAYILEGIQNGTDVNSDELPIRPKKFGGKYR
ncbi:MAG: hypothetical protein Phog2KO_40710 [Phototrophicaceae bacterium]